MQTAVASSYPGISLILQLVIISKMKYDYNEKLGLNILFVHCSINSYVDIYIASVHLVYVFVRIGHDRRNACQNPTKLTI